jgi:hypothetical protein
MEDREYTLEMSPESIKAALASSRSLLAAPSHADVRGEGGKQTKQWYELFGVVNSKLGPNKKNAALAQIEVELVVSAEGDDLTNVGRHHWQYFFVNPASRKGDEDWDQQNRNLSSIHNLLRACGLSDQVDAYLDNGQKVPYHEFFNREKPLVGKTIRARVREYINRDGDPQQDVSRFWKHE